MCNRECEHGLTCPNEDCINDEVSLSERQDQSKLDSLIKSEKPIKRRNRDKAKNRVHQAKHYAKNRNDEVERVKEYYKEHEEERRAYGRAYYYARKRKKVE